MKDSKIFLDGLRGLVESKGGTIEMSREGKWFVIQCVAPAGHRWSCSGTILLRSEWLGTRDKPRRAADAHEALRDAYDRVAHGVETIPEDELEDATEAAGLARLMGDLLARLDDPDNPERN
jgi:hypothetical protein